MADSKNLPGTADHVGQAAGGITGVVAGAAIGSSAGPIGTLLGGIAGAIGGWWSGRAIAEAAEDITEADEQFYRADFDRRREPRDSSADRRREPPDYDRARAAYLLGDVASANPEYQSFENGETELARAWTRRAENEADWTSVREYAAVGFRHGRERRRKPR
jgi:hypothetical protein